MERREFLQLGGLAAVAGGASGCRHILGSDGGLSVDGMDRVLAGVDRMVGKIRGWFAPAETAPPQQRVVAEGLADVLASLAVYSAFTDLPIAGQVHPGMQARMADAGTWMARGHETMAPVVQSEDPAVWKTTERGRRRLPEADAILADAELELEELGVGFPGRKRFRQLLRRAVNGLGARNARAFTREQLAAVGPMPEGPPTASADPAMEREVAQAQQSWISAGVPAVAFTQPLASTRGLKAFGLSFIIVGGVLFTIGLLLAVAAPECWCIGAFVALIGLAFFIPGLIVFLNAQRKAKEQASEG